MKSVLFGICAMVIVSAIAWAVMGSLSESSGDAFVSKNNSVRLN